MAGSDYCGRGGSKAGKRAKWQSALVILSSLAPKQKSHASFDILVQLFNLRLTVIQLNWFGPNP